MRKTIARWVALKGMVLTGLAFPACGNNQDETSGGRAGTTAAGWGGTTAGSSGGGGSEAGAGRGGKDAEAGRESTPEGGRSGGSDPGGSGDGGEGGFDSSAGEGGYSGDSGGASPSGGTGATAGGAGGSGGAPVDACAPVGCTDQIGPGVSGDVPEQRIITGGVGVRTWYWVEVHETLGDGDGSRTNVGVRLTLTSPPGVDYDLTWDCDSECTIYPTNTVHNLTGHTETLWHVEHDIGGRDEGNQSFSVHVGILAHQPSQDQCIPWTLTITTGPDVARGMSINDIMSACPVI
jgi:hypothetical protein